LNLLLINSSDENAFAALWNSKKLHVSYSSDFENKSLRKLPDNLINCLYEISSDHKAEFEKVKAIAVTTGPGSFTGIRVGLSIAKGVAAALGIPVIPITNFELAYSRIINPDKENKYCILIGAKLPEYYYSIWRSDNEIQTGCIEIDQLSSIIGEKTTIVANFEDDSNGKHSYFTHINSKDLAPETDTMVKLALDKLNKGELRNPEDIEPLYMKEFVIKKH
jgi:tRNA threonylcarbamoyladenosine biosynthesis protein TsaB